MQVHSFVKRYFLMCILVFVSKMVTYGYVKKSSLFFLVIQKDFNETLKYVETTGIVIYEIENKLRNFIIMRTMLNMF